MPRRGHSVPGQTGAGLKPLGMWEHRARAWGPRPFFCPSAARGRRSRARRAASLRRPSGACRRTPPTVNPDFGYRSVRPAVSGKRIRRAARPPAGRPGRGCSSANAGRGGRAAALMAADVSNFVLQSRVTGLRRRRRGGFSEAKRTGGIRCHSVSDTPPAGRRGGFRPGPPDPGPRGAARGRRRRVPGLRNRRTGSG